MAYPTTLDSFSTKTDNSTTVAAADVNDLQTAIVAVETALGYGATVPVSTATNSTIVKRDSSAGAAFAAVTATTVTASGQFISTATGGGTVGGLYLNAAAPAIGIRVSGAATDAKLWDIIGGPTPASLFIRAVNDANAVAVNAIAITRSGTTITDITLSATALTLTGAPTVSGATVLSSTLAVTGATTLSSTLAVTGAGTFSSTVAVTGVLTGTGGVAGPRSSGTAVFALDASATGSTFSVANNATATPFASSANFSGMFIVNDTATDGAVGVFITGGNAMVKVSESLANVYTITQATASRVNVYLATQVVTIENKTGSTRTFSVMALRSRNGN